MSRADTSARIQRVHEAFSNTHPDKEVPKMTTTHQMVPKYQVDAFLRGDRDSASAATMLSSPEQIKTKHSSFVILYRYH
jgi:hypothetical protein